MKVDLQQGLERFQGLVKKSTEEDTFSYDSVVNRLTALQTDIEVAETKGIFVSLPDKEPEKSEDVSRIKTIRNRLANLGYLESDSGQEALDGGLKNAIRRFQQEARLKDDGWVGIKTWSALQELVSFETPSNLVHWFEDGQLNKALARAVRLRLFVLGLAKSKPRSQNVQLESGLKEFCRVWDILNLGDKKLQPKPSLETVSILFDQDKLVDRLSNARAPSSKTELRQTHGFILNAAKIELWLAGYDVRPDGYDFQKYSIWSDLDEEEIEEDFEMRSPSVSQAFQLIKDKPLFNALVSFWTDYDTIPSQSEKIASQFFKNFPRFFKQVSFGIQAHTEMTESEKHVEIENFLKQYPDQIQTVWDNVRELGNRVWDGIKRAWGWLKNLVKRAVKKVITIGRNLSRLIYDYALGAYSVVSNVLKSFVSTVYFFVNKTIEGSDLHHAMVAHDRDFDFKTAINSSANPEKVYELCIDIERKTRIFVFTCRVLSVFISILIAVIKTGITGYLGLVFALVKLRNYLSSIESLVQQYQAIF